MNFNSSNTEIPLSLFEHKCCRSKQEIVKNKSKRPIKAQVRSNKGVVEEFKHSLMEINGINYHL